MEIPTTEVRQTLDTKLGELEAAFQSRPREKIIVDMEGFVRGTRAMLQQVRTIRAEKGEAAANAQYSDFVSRIFMMDMLLNEKSASKLSILTQGRPVDLAVFDDDIKAKSKAVLDLACPS